MALKNKRTSNVGGVQIHVESAYDKIQIVADNITELLALETHFKEMNGIYLGTLSANPTTRSDASALQNGDHYYNSSSKLIYKYIDGAWVYNTVFYNEADLNAAVGTGPFNVWIAYADSATGTGISTLPSGKEFIGIANGKSTPTVDTSDPTVFTWTDFKGDTGAQGAAGSNGSTGSDGDDGVVAIQTPTTPASVVIVVTSTTAKFTWTPPTYGGHGYTKVYKTAWSGSAPTFNESYLVASIQGHFVDIGLTPAQNYRYWFRHVNLNGVSSNLSLSTGHQVLTTASLENTNSWLSAANLDAALTTRLDKLDATLFSINGVNKVGVLGALAQLDTNTTTLNGNFNSLQSVVGNGGSGLIEDFNDLKTAYDATVVTVGSNSSGTVAAVNKQGAHYFLKHNVNGRISGFGLSSTVAQGEYADAQVTSQFAVLADDFVIAHPATGTNANQATVPFRIVNGTTFIKEAIIEEMTASKITAGTIATQNILIGSSNFNISGAKYGSGKGALVVNPDPDTGSLGTGDNIDVLTIGWLNSTDIGIHLKDAAGATVFKSGTTVAANLANSSQQWSDIAGIPTGIIETYYQAATPTAGTSAIGDYWIDSDDGKTYRLASTSPDSWVLVQDQSIIDALANAATAQATADGKIITFIQGTAPTATSVGDLWMDSANDNIMYRATAVGASNWVLVSDTRIATAITDASNAQATADGKILTFYQTTAPASGISVGDLWIDTDDGAKMYRYSGSSWISIQDTSIATAQADASTGIANASTAQSAADGKVVTFIATTAPTAEGTGDLWFDSDDNNKLYRWSGSAWTAYAQDAADWGNVFSRPTDTELLNTNTTATDVGLGNVTNVSQASIQSGTLQAAAWSDIVGTLNAPTSSADVTSANAAASIAGQGAFALLSQITLASQIANTVITNVHINDLSADKINAGTINAARINTASISSNLITGDHLAANTITAATGNIADLTVTSLKIAAGGVITSRVADNAITNIESVTNTNLWLCTNTSYSTATSSTILNMNHTIALDDFNSLILMFTSSASAATHSVTQKTIVGFFSGTAVTPLDSGDAEGFYGTWLQASGGGEHAIALMYSLDVSTDTGNVTYSVRARKGGSNSNVYFNNSNFTIIGVKK